MSDSGKVRSAGLRIYNCESHTLSLSLCLRIHLNTYRFDAIFGSLVITPLGVGFHVLEVGLTAFASAFSLAAGGGRKGSLGLSTSCSVLFDYRRGV